MNIKTHTKTVVSYVHYMK